MKIKFLFICSVAAAGFVTFSLTDKCLGSNDVLLSQVEAQAENETPPTPSGRERSNVIKQQECPIFITIREWVQLSDGTWGWKTTKIPNGTDWFPVVECVSGEGSCTPYSPC